MTDNDVIKALECCNREKGSCQDCPLWQRDGSCIKILTRISLDLVNRQKADLKSESMAEWISVKDRLPVANEKDESRFFLKAYLVAQHNGFMMKTALWNGKYWILWGHSLVVKDVTHWMPLPEKPEPQ